MNTVQESKFVIIARGGAFISPYISEVVLRSDDPDCIEWLKDDNESDFDDWCNWTLNCLTDELDDNGASVIVLSLEEYRDLPRL
jgi:hypothetical protein